MSTSKKKQTISYTAEKVIGSGSFGVVFLATAVGSDELVAIKKVLQDKRYKNRELSIMKLLKHPNVVQLKHCFYSTGDKKDEVYLNLVLKYVPETIYRVVRQYTKAKQRMPVLDVKLYGYQLARALLYCHAKNIAHRDLKPQNLLVDPEAGVLQLCDFGSAKVLVEGEPNVSYICSRYYRAPELIFGSTTYTTAIDIWSFGCVLAEMLLGPPLFPGDSGVDQLVEIIKVLGTPTREDIHDMNSGYADFKFPKIKSHHWSKVFGQQTPEAAVDLISKILVYSPQKRLSAAEIMMHPFFDELKEYNNTSSLPNGNPFPELFNWTEEEVTLYYKHSTHTEGKEWKGKRC